jgi:hypothetical protein
MLDYVRSHLLGREDAELLFFMAQSVILIVAVVALLYARAEVKESRRNSAIIATQAQATFLLRLVDEWNSPEVREARKCFVIHSTKVKQDVFSHNNHLKDSEIMSEVKERFRVEIRKMKEEDIVGDYSTLMLMCSFFETVGLLVRKKYVDINDIDALFRGPILNISTYFAPHIKDRQREKDSAPGMYENVLYLASEIEQLKR